METSPQQLEEVITRIIKTNDFVTRDEFLRSHNEVMDKMTNGFDSILGKLADLEQEYMFIKEWINKHEKKEKEMQATISALIQRVEALEKQSA